jgi:DNA-binding GntR family transcriptional regulator
MPLTRAEFVAERIEHAILRGELAAGERIVEGVLAEQLNVSKTPIREALLVLARKGVVTSHAYRGSVVRDIGPQEAWHLYEVRLLIEPDAVVRAIPHHDSVSLAACRDALLVARNAGGEDSHLADRSIANRRFHRSLYARCENAQLRKILDDIQDQVAMITVSTWRRRATWVEEESEHAAILEAVEAGQSDLAHRLMKEHISSFFSKIGT